VTDYQAAAKRMKKILSPPPPLSEQLKRNFQEIKDLFHW
jgi:hypothetical protein